MKKVLILGGSHRDIPLINASKELGYFTITLGGRDYYIGHKYADKFYKTDFNDLNAVKKIAEDEKIDYLIPGCGEESYLNSVKLAYEFNMGNLDNPQTAKLIHNKWKFKEFCLKNSISVPKGFYYKGYNIDLDNLNFPVVVKPTNLSGGRGVKVAKNKKELKVYLKETSAFSNEIFIEEYIEGQLIAYSIFLQNQKIIYEFIGEDRTYLNPYLITTAYPVKLNETIVKRLKNDIEKMAKLLKLVDGMFHLQVIIKDKTPYIIDVTRRIPGDLYPYLIEFCDGVEYSKAVIKAYTIGKIDNEFKHKNKIQNFVIRHVVMPNKNGEFKGIDLSKNIKNKIIYNLPLIEPEYKITNYLSTQLSILFIKNIRNENIMDFLNNNITVNIQNF